MRRRILAIVTGSFAILLLAAGLAASFLDWGGRYSIGPDMVQSRPVTESEEAANAVSVSTRRRLDPDDGMLVAAGQDLYRIHCAACHGADLEGQPNWRQRKPDGKMPAPPHDDTGHTWHHPDDLLFAITKQGSKHVSGLESDMPGYAGILSDRDIIAILSYIKSTWSLETRERHDRVNRRNESR